MSAAATTATPGARRALTIGINAYDRSPLRNPRNDAKAIYQSLTRTGWQALNVLDPDSETMFKAIHSFIDSIEKGDGVFFFFAGHGEQYQNKNYMLATNLPGEDRDLPRKAPNMHDMLDQITAKEPRFTVVLLDCCRTFAGMTRSARSVTRGLVEMSSPCGTIIGYACAPGRTASDGTAAGGHGIYTKHILRNIERPGVPLLECMNEIAIGVEQETDGNQVPWMSMTALRDRRTSLCPGETEEEKLRRLLAERDAEMAKLNVAATPTIPKQVCAPAIVSTEIARQAASCVLLATFQCQVAKQRLDAAGERLGAPYLFWVVFLCVSAHIVKPCLSLGGSIYLRMAAIWATCALDIKDRFKQVPDFFVKCWAVVKCWPVVKRWQLPSYAGKVFIAWLDQFKVLVFRWCVPGIGVLQVVKHWVEGNGRLGVVDIFVDMMAFAWAIHPWLYAELNNDEVFDIDVDNEQIIAWAKEATQSACKIHLICPDITDSAIIVLAENCKGLEDIYLFQCNIADAGLRALAENCKGLTQISLYQCTNITDVGLRALAKNCKGLAYINLRGCTKITGGGFRALADGCKGLAYIGLNNTKITSAGLRALAENCKGLAEIDLCNCNKITDAGLRALAENCKGLEKIFLLKCNITNAGLRALAENCKGLAQISLYQCTNITYAGLWAFKAALPACSVSGLQ